MPGYGYIPEPQPSTPKVLVLPKVPIILGICLLAIVLLLTSCTFVVDMTHQAVITRFNRVTRIIVAEMTPELQTALSTDPKLAGIKVQVGKGLCFKVPFLDNVDTYLSTLITYDTDPREVVTKDKKKIVLDNFAQWRIINPALFKIATRTETVAHQRVDDVLYSQLNVEIGKIETSQLISDKDYVEQMMKLVTENTNRELQANGIAVVGVRIKRTDLPEENLASIYARMSTERQQQAKQYRSEGEEEALRIRSDADKQVEIIRSEAYAEAQKIRGQGEAEAARIYAETYGRDPDFYQFYKSIETLRATMGDNVIITIPADSDLAHYLYSAH